MNAAARKIIDEKFAELRRGAEWDLGVAELEIIRWRDRTTRSNDSLDDAFVAARAIADALVMAHAIALGVAPGVVVR